MAGRARLDQDMVRRGLVSTRSQAESYIKLGQVKVNGQTIIKPAHQVVANDGVELTAQEQYVSRAALKLASVADTLKLDFMDKVVLDVGSSTGGFTDYALKHGAKKVIAVDVGTNQLHPSLHNDPRVELHEQTDIRGFKTNDVIDLVVADVSFISLREILPSITKQANEATQIVVMAKPQFEAAENNLKHKGVIKNDHMRRDILKSFEQWANQHFVIIAKADSQVKGATGNLERFYLLRATPSRG
ncbi:MAG TPA: TlyA family RNA methyltransferase [Patescibacteria group bacterium]|nr:TlyA family RNA methyltransferase [Patescibacteria group bacterium]